MKPLKTLNAWLMALVCLSLTILACNDDDDNETEKEVTIESIIGSWQYEEEEGSETITFNDDGSMQSVIKEYYDGKWETVTKTGTYTLKNNIITLFSYGIKAGEVKVKSVTPTSLILEMEDEEDGNYSRTYKKV